MKKTYVMSGSGILWIETIEFEGRLWLVPDWLVMPDGKAIRPLRIIGLRMPPDLPRMTLAEFQDVFGKRPLPQSLLERGVIPPELERVVEVRESPDIEFPNPDGLH